MNVTKYKVVITIGVDWTLSSTEKFIDEYEDEGKKQNRLKWNFIVNKFTKTVSKQLQRKLER